VDIQILSQKARKGARAGTMQGSTAQDAGSCGVRAIAKKPAVGEDKTVLSSGFGRRWI
jgi:hypothetical protein